MGPFTYSGTVGWRRWDSKLWGANVCVATGLVLFLVLLLMVVSSLPSIRRKAFKFYSVRNICANLFFLILLVHGVYNAVLYKYKWVAAPLMVYAIDRIVRLAKIVSTCEMDSFIIEVLMSRSGQKGTASFQYFH